VFLSSGFVKAIVYD